MTNRPADITFVIDANDAGLVQASRRAIDNLNKIERAFDDLRVAARTGDAQVRKFAAGVDDVDLGPMESGTKKVTLSAEKLGQALSLVNPRLGELTAKVGGLGAAGGPLVAAGAAATAFGAAWAGVVVSMLDAIRHIDDLTEALTEQQRQALTPYIKNIEQVRDTFDAIGNSLTETQIRVLSGFANGVRDIAQSVDTLANAFNRLDEATDGRVSDFVGRVLAGQNPLAAAIAAGLGPGAGGGGSTATVEPGTGPLVDAPQPGGGGSTATVEPGTGPLVDAPQPGGLTFDMQADVQRRMAESARAPAPRRQTSSNRPADDAARNMVGSFDVALDDIKIGIEAVLDDLSVKEIDRVIGPEFLAALEHREELSAQYHEAEMARIAERKRTENEALTTTLTIASNTVGAIGSLWGTLAEAQGASAREVFAIQKATAIAQAALGIPLAIMEGLKSGGPAAPALAAVYGALAAAQLAVVAATPPPKFHSGGMLAPDEETITVRTNERLAVLTSQGADGVARMNAGRPAGEPVAEYYFIDRYGMRRAERFARPRPELAVSRRGGW